MPAKPAYFHRIEEALEAFRRLPSDWIDRRTIQETLGVSRTVAWRILRSCGASEGPGNALVCRRQDAIGAFEALRKTGRYEQEIARRERLDRQLGQLLGVARSQHLRVAAEDRALEMVSSRFGRLPAGVELTRERLTVEFSGVADFLEKVGAVVFALHNDYESIATFLEDARG